jgi:CBS domain-containing protein
MTGRQIKEIISGQLPLVLPPDTTIREACKHMHARRVGAVLIINTRKQLIGIFTGRDVVRCLAKGKDPAATRLRQVMTRNPQAAHPEAFFIEVLRLMRDGGFRHVPVVDGDVVVGIVSRADFRGLEQDRLEEETGIWERI